VERQLIELGWLPGTYQVYSLHDPGLFVHLSGDSTLGAKGVGKDLQGLSLGRLRCCAGGGGGDAWLPGTPSSGPHSWEGLAS
jgi:hypothetical protein